MSILSIGELLDLGSGGVPSTGLIPYSALEYNETGAISGISGSAIAGGVDTTVVSSIASSYVESGVSSKVDQSAFEDCCSAMSAAVSAKLDASASSQFQPSGSYADASSLSSKLDASASSMFAPSGNYAPAGDYAFNSSLSSKLDASASSQFAPSGDYVFNSSYSSFTGDVTNNISSISSVVSGITGDWSSKADESSLSSYVNYSAISGEGGKVTSINGSGISATVTPIPTMPLYVASPLIAGIDEMSSQITLSIAPDTYATTASISSLSAKQDKSAMTAYQPTGNYQTAGNYLSSTTFNNYTASTNIVQIIANSADATGTNIIYVVTGEA